MTKPIEDIRAVQNMRWNEEHQTYLADTWVLQFRRGVTDEWEEVKVKVNYIGGKFNGKTTINQKDAEQ